MLVKAKKRAYDYVDIKISKEIVFSNAANGAKASAVLYSIIETATSKGLTPFDYITYCLKQLSYNEVDVENLLLWSV